MDVSQLLLDLYGRIPPLAGAALNGLSPDQLAQPPTPGSNTIGWLVWHTARVQDHHVAELLDTPQIWTGGDWARRCGLEPDPNNTGYGHRPGDVTAVRPESVDVLLGYLGEVDARTRGYLRDPRSRRARPGGRPPLGPAGLPRRAPHQRGRRRPPTPRAGRLRTRAARLLSEGDRVRKGSANAGLSAPAGAASARTRRSARWSRSRGRGRSVPPSVRPAACTTTHRVRRPGWWRAW